MTKTDKEKLLTLHDELVESWQKAENGNDEHAEAKSETYYQAVSKIRASFPSLFANS